MPLEERVELDVEEALRSVDSIEAALTGAAQSFKVALAEALDLLATVAIGEVDAAAVTVGIDAAVEAANLEPAIEPDAAGVTTAIDDAVAAADTSPLIDADASGVTASIDEAVDAADATVTPEAITDQVTDQIEQALADADTTIEVEADTSQAEDEINGLGDAASAAGGSVGGLGLGMGQLNAATEAATGSLAGLEGGLAATHPAAGAAAAGVAALGGATLALFHAALDSDTAQRRFNSALGDMADRVAGLNIEGFASDLEGLAEAAGSDDEAMKLAAARIADLGKSAGAASPDIATTAENILLLATRATVLNPTLGDAGDVADRMTNAFARGGRALAPFGIALSSAEINARALADTGKDSADQLTIFDKAAAGAAITTEKLGDHLKSDIVEGAKGTEISLRSLREQFKNTLEELGKPLLKPIIDAIRAGQPVLLDLARVLGELAQAILPVVLKAFEAGAPIIHAVALATEGLLAVLSPLLELIAAIPAPFLTAVGAVALLATTLGPLISAIGVGLSAAVGLGSAALGALFTPIGAVAVGVGLLANAWANHAKQQAASNARVREGAAAFEDEAKSVSDAIAAIAEKRIPKNQQDDINRLGLSYRQVGTLALEGKEGLDQFVDAMVRSGEVTPQVGAALKANGGDVNDLRNNVVNLGITQAELETQNLGLIETFTSLSGEQQKSAKAALEHMLATDQLSGAQEKEARAAVNSKDAHVDYVGVLAEVKPTSDDAKSGIDDVTGGLDDQAGQAQVTEEALQGYLDAIMGFVNSQIAAESAALKFKDSLVEVEAKTKALAEAIKAHGARSAETAVAQRDLDDAVRGSRDDAIAAAEANVRLAIDTGKVQEGSAGAAEQFAIYRQSLVDAANAASGPVKQALLDLITQIDNTKAAGDINLQITADTEAAERALASLNRKLDSLNRGIVGVTVGGASMAGGDWEGGAAGQFITVGERGRELAFVSPGSTMSVIPNNRTEDILANGLGGGGSTFNIFPVTDDPAELAFRVDTHLGNRRR